MMLTKEECLNSVNELILNWGYEGLEEDLEPIYQLIEEHFENPPLEWEEIKECNVVYDKEEKKYRLIEDFLENGKRIVFTNTIDSFITENYESNRFYRKEVK